MYLSRLLLNPYSRQVQRELADPYQLHRTIIAAFPSQLPHDERVLFRLELNPRQVVPLLLVQSQHPPDWSFLTETEQRAYLLLEKGSDGGEHNPAVKEFHLQLTINRQLHFRLLANPTVKRAGKRYGLYKDEEQQAWLERKLQVAGCQLLEVRIDRQEKQRSALYREAQRHQLLFFAVLFNGILTVEDPERLLTAVRDGVGSGKGLGFGLLSLAPIEP